jgi:hypothetical protein
MVCLYDMIGEFLQGCGVPAIVQDLFDRHRTSQHFEHCVYCNVRLAARFVQWALASAAIVDSKRLKHSGRLGVLQDYVPHGRLRS